MLNQLPIYARLAISMTISSIIIAIGFISLALWSSDRYHQEVTQKLHQNLAQYVLDHLPAPLFQADESGDLAVSHQVLKSIAINTMMINPSVEVYLLDPQGELLGHALPEKSVDTATVDIRPISALLTEKIAGPVLGQNPRKPDEANIFSVAPVMIDDKMHGYLYVILASQEALSLAQQLSNSHVFRLTVGAVCALLLFFGLTSLASFNRITKPLRALAKDVKDYRQQSLDSSASLHSSKPAKQQDEVDALADAFTLMQQRIQTQFDQLSESDRIRRELISNVSHDLRTPLASMQGYLETLLLKSNEVSESQKTQYLHIAHRHSKHLNNLITQLFELSKLDAGQQSLKREVFSVTELLYDVKQDYELIAQRKQIKLGVVALNENSLVFADISLIQRVFQNLIDNALKHTPEGGEIKLALTVENNKIAIGIQDTGAGIHQDELPFVFDRFYQSPTPASNSSSNHSKPLGAGLGLSIVKRILDLHDCLIHVESTPDSGTCFRFVLPRPA